MKKVFTALAVPFALLAGPVAVAQEGFLEEVIVTATKREESAQDIPIAVSAFTGEDLQARGVIDVMDMQQVTPSLSINDSNSTSGGTTMRIRGMGTTGNNIGLESAVGFFMDGVYRSRAGQAMSDLIDIDRVEVLRGPQGTLFGKNTSAGAISVISARPEYEFGGRANISAGDYDLIKGEAVVTGPIIQDVLAGRLAVGIHERDGYYEDIDTGKDAYSDRDRWTIKGSLLWNPTDNFEALLIADYTERENVCCPAGFHQITDFDRANVEALGGTINITDDPTAGVNFAPFDDSEDGGAVLTMTWGINDGMDLISVTSYRTYENVRGQDVDFSNADIYALGDSDHEIDNFSQEFRLLGSTENIDWLFGVYYGDEEIKSAGDFIRLSEDGPAFLDLSYCGGAGVCEGILSPGDGVESAATQDGETWAIFTHNTWHATDRLDFTVGLRWSSEEKDATNFINDTRVPDIVDESQWPCALFPFPTFCNSAGFVESRKDEKLTGTFKIAYNFTDDIMAYVSYAHGFKSGGFNLDPNAYKMDADTGESGPVTSDGREFDKEVVDTYELGLKSQLAGGRLTLNGAVFYTDIEDYQLNEFTGVGFEVTNQEEASLTGFEIDYTWFLADGIILTGGITHSIAEYGDVGDPRLDNNQLTNAPKWQSSNSLLVDRPLGSSDWRYTLNLNWLWRDDVNTGSSWTTPRFRRVTTS